VRLTPLFLVCAVLVAATAPAEPQAAMRVSRVQAEADFGAQLLFPCLTHVERGVPIAELPQTYRAGLVAAPPDARFKGGRFEGATSTWYSKLMGANLSVVEVGADKCIVVADQLPVDETLRLAAEATTRLKPPFAQVAPKPSYDWPVVYETQRTINGKKITARFEGAEPGAAGHLYRFSLMFATVTTQTAP